MSSLLGNSLKYLGVKGPDFATFKWFKRREKEGGVEEGRGGAKEEGGREEKEMRNGLDKGGI